MKAAPSPVLLYILFFPFLCCHSPPPPPSNPALSSWHPASLACSRGSYRGWPGRGPSCHSVGPLLLGHSHQNHCSCPCVCVLFSQPGWARTGAVSSAHPLPPAQYPWHLLWGWRPGVCTDTHHTCSGLPHDRWDPLNSV